LDELICRDQTRAPEHFTARANATDKIVIDKMRQWMSLLTQRMEPTKANIGLVNCHVVAHVPGD
jgi:hypothetical protein